MNIKKMAVSFLAAAMVLVTASGTAVTSSATKLAPSENPEPGLSSSEGTWLLYLYNTSSYPNIKYDIDYSKVAKLSVTFTVVEEDRDLWSGDVAGAVWMWMESDDIPEYETDENGDPIYETDENGDIVYKTDYDTGEFLLDENGNKIPKEKTHPLREKYGSQYQIYSGLTDEELGLETARDEDISVEKVGDYTYKLTTNEFANPLANGDARSINSMPLAFFEWLWTASEARIRVTNVDVLDGSDNVLISFDGNGKATVPAGEPDTSEPDTSEPDTSEPDTSSTPSFPSTTPPDDTGSAPESSDSTTDNTSTPDEKVEFAPEPVVDETVDEETAKVIAEIKVSAPEAAFEAGTKLAVKKDNSVDAENAFALDISFTLNGSSVQPKNGASVTVSVPVPPMFKDVNEDLLKVFHYLNGKYTRVEATVNNGMVTFDTTHFSTYVISPDDLTANNPAESSTVTSATPNPSTGVAAVSALPIAVIVSAVVIISKKKK